MKKKIVLLTLMTALMLSLVACGEKKNEETGASSKEDNLVAVEVFDSIWAKYGEDDKFPAAGGDLENMSMEGPAIYDVSDVDGLVNMLYIPKDQVDDIQEVSSLMHMMNSNTFTGAAVRVKESEKLSAFVDALKSNIDGVQWICGAPEKIVVIKFGGNTCAYAFGETSIIDTFKAKAMDAYSDATVLIEEDISFGY